MSSRNQTPCVCIQKLWMRLECLALLGLRRRTKLIVDWFCIEQDDIVHFQLIRSHRPIQSDDGGFVSSLATASGSRLMIFPTRTHGLVDGLLAFAAWNLFHGTFTLLGLFFFQNTSTCFSTWFTIVRTITLWTLLRFSVLVIAVWLWFVCLPCTVQY